MPRRRKGVEFSSARRMGAVTTHEATVPSSRDAPTIGALISVDRLEGVESRDEHGARRRRSWLALALAAFVSTAVVLVPGAAPPELLRPQSDPPRAERHVTGAIRAPHRSPNAARSRRRRPRRSRAAPIERRRQAAPKPRRRVLPRRHALSRRPATSIAAPPTPSPNPVAPASQTPSVHDASRQRRLSGSTPEFF
jgi:hypothetical protein